MDADEIILEPDEITEDGHTSVDDDDEQLVIETASKPKGKKAAKKAARRLSGASMKYKAKKIEVDPEPDTIAELEKPVTDRGPKPFTLPMFPTAKPQQQAINADPVVAFDWWYRKVTAPNGKKSLDWIKPPDDMPQTKPRYTAYFYRQWPKIDPGLVGIAHRYILKSHTWPFINAEGKHELDWRKGTLALFGTGRYKIEMVDYYASRPIANWEYEVTDWAHNPPRLNLDMVMMESPENKQFITQMRARGVKLPGDEGYKQFLKGSEDDDMGTAAVEVMGKMLDRTLDKLDQQQPVASDGNVTAVMMQQMGSLIRDVVTTRGGDEGYKLVLEAIKSLKDLKPDAGESQMIQMITSMHNTQVEALKSQHETQMLVMREREKENKAEIERLRRELSETQQKLMDTRNELNKSTDITSQVMRVRELKEMLGSDAPPPRRRVVEAPPADAPPAWLPMVMQVAAPFLQQMMAQMGGQAAAGAPAPPQPQQAPTGAIPATAGAAQQPGAPQPTPQSAPVMNQGPSGPSPEGIKLFGERQAMALFTAYAMFLSNVEQPLVQHLLNEELHGEDFAQWVIDGYGRNVYAQVRGIGATDLAKAIVTYAPIWDKVKELVTLLELEEFAQRFVDAEKIFAEEAAAEAAAEAEADNPKNGSVKEGLD